MKLFVIGNPIKHSKSPFIHNYWLKKHKLHVVYEKKLIKKEELSSVIELVKNKKIIGFNVTLPFKESIIKHLDKLHPSAKESMAVNTVYLDKKNKITGANTDGIGFMEYLMKDLEIKIKNKSFYIIGAGGAALGIISTLVKFNPSKIEIINRTKKKALTLAKKFSNTNVAFSIGDWENLIPDKDKDIIINTTSFGMVAGEKIKLDKKNLTKNTLIFDIIYKPKQTEFLKDFSREGFKTYNGIGMLIRQAATAFNFWFEKNKISNQDVKAIQKILK